MIQKPQKNKFGGLQDDDQFSVLIKFQNLNMTYTVKIFIRTLLNISEKISFHKFLNFSKRFIYGGANLYFSRYRLHLRNSCILNPCSALCTETHRLAANLVSVLLIIQMLTKILWNHLNEIQHIFITAIVSTTLWGRKTKLTKLSLASCIGRDYYIYLRFFTIPIGTKTT